MKTILITGINGFLGSHLAKYLDQYYNIVGLEIDIKNLWRIAGFEFPVFKAENKQIDKLFNSYSIDFIIHTATLYGRDNTPNSTLVENNILEPIRLLEKGIQNNIKAFINTDSFFNDGKFYYSYLSGYTTSKKHLLEWLQQYTKQVKIINMKIFHMYGPNDASGKFIPWIINQLKNNEPEIDLTPGGQRRDFIYIEDVLEAYKVVLVSMDDIQESSITYQVGTGKSITLREFIEMAKKLQNSSSRLNFGKLDYRVGEIMISESDISNLVKLGWEPKIGFYQGLLKTINTQ